MRFPLAVVLLISAVPAAAAAQDDPPATPEEYAQRAAEAEEGVRFLERSEERFLHYRDVLARIQEILEPRR